MVKTDYKRALKAAEREMLRLMQEKETIHRRIEDTRQTILALRTKVDGDPIRGVSAFMPRTLTDAVMAVLVSARKPLVPIEVRDRVLVLGFKMSSSNPLASIHSVIKRMYEQGRIRFAGVPHPTMGYQLLAQHGYWWAEFAPPKGLKVFTPEEYSDATAMMQATLGKEKR